MAAAEGEKMAFKTGQFQFFSSLVWEKQVSGRRLESGSRAEKKSPRHAKTVPIQSDLPKTSQKIQIYFKKPLEKWWIPQQPWRKGEKLTLAGLQKIVLGMNVAELVGAAQQPLKEEEEEKSKFRGL